MLEARRNVTSTIASQRTGLGSPKGCHLEFIPPTGSPEPNNGLQAGAWRRSRSIYSVSASAKTELLAPSKARLGRRRHKWARGHAMRLVLPSPLPSEIQTKVSSRIPQPIISLSTPFPRIFFFRPGKIIENIYRAKGSESTDRVLILPRPVDSWTHESK